MPSAPGDARNRPARKTVIFQRACAAVFACLVVATAVAVRAPQMTPVVRGILVAMFLSGAITALAYLIPYVAAHPRWLYPALFLLGLAIVWSVLGDRPPEPNMLEHRYLNRLRNFEGVPYVLSGETERGVGPAGLARVGLWQAMLHEGIKEMNPRLIGVRFWKFWWRDLTLRDLARGKYGYTRPIGRAPMLAGYDADDPDSGPKLRPGDLAIVGNNEHVLVYMRNDRWIDAGPDTGKVTIAEAPADSQRHWHRMPVTFLRWRIFEEGD